ncbi:glycosyltransferase [Chamaesiphon minutus]|uniref:Glycosyl transferase, UDP-glucuronosyltransferase n=1 Tax=Chamaesiphon minutus (strain ATCC 27169 / PCC 6605) TaxID=1173020 RepID=K9UQP0_CHAP6|nr:glycosyltransferase [Chamaesiphon minutus]AFY97003.1 glycosyl transferase, UDP-glucuronosyltransferase [Chamaesiphon minutus PCC 6605]
MSRIAVTTLGTLGDLHPMIAIALELRQRGHDVVFVTHEVYQSKLQALGFEFHSMRPDFTAMNDPQEMARMMDLKTGQEYMVRQWVNPHLREMYTDLLNVAKDVDFIFSGEGVIVTPLVAEKLGMRWASSAMVPLSFFSIYDPPVLAPFPALAKLYKLGPLVNRGVLNFAKYVSNSWADPIRQLRRELDLSPIDYNLFLENRFSPYLVVALFSSVLGQPQPDWAENTVIAGFTFYDGTQDGAELAPELKQFLEAGDPPIVFTLGSAAVMNAGNFYKESLQAVTQLNRRAVFLIGNNPPLKNLPANVLAVNYAPYSQIFPRACAIVHQGGIGTTAQALRAGRPTLIMPYSHDQPDNAARIQRLGTSRTISRKQYSASRVAKELSELLENPSYRTKASEIGRIMQAEDGVGVACDAIEQQLRAVVASS